MIRASGSVGKRHRDHKTTGNVIKKGSGGVSSALATYFFGPNLDQKLSIGDFLKFQQELHRGVLELEVSEMQTVDICHYTWLAKITIFSLLT